MGQPTPPGDSPLYDGLGSEWNDIISAFPEDRRSELAPKLKERISAYEPLKPWEKFNKEGVTPEQADAALNIARAIDNNPKEVYETIGKHLGITAAQAEAVVEELEDADQDDPRIAKMQQQLDTLIQINLAQRGQTKQQEAQAAAEKQIQDELDGLRTKYGKDAVDEEQIVMRMLHQDMTAEEAFNAHTEYVDNVRRRRPAPLIMGGSGGSIPGKAIDPRKLDSKGTKDLVAQMLTHANNEAKG